MKNLFLRVQIDLYKKEIQQLITLKVCQQGVHCCFKGNVWIIIRSVVLKKTIHYSEQQW